MSNLPGSYGRFSCQTVKSGRKIPPGFVRCEQCGEYNGTTKKEYLDWPGPVRPWLDKVESFSVLCLCHGIPCSGCKQNLIHRPISNSYDELTNEIGHWPYFSAQMPCNACQKQQAGGRGR